MKKTIFRSILGRMMALTTLCMLAFAGACGDDGGTTPDDEKPQPPQPPVEEVVITIEQTAASWEDVEIKFSIEGAESYYAGVEAKGSYSSDTVLMGVATDAYELNTATTYEGSITAFPAENDLTVKPATTYVVWVVAHNKEGYYTKENIFTQEVSSTADTRAPEVTLEMTSATFNDIQIKVGMESVTSYYAGCEPTSIFSADEVILYANEQGYTAYTKGSYEGSICNFPTVGSMELAPATDYTLWVLPINSEGVMTVDELFTLEVATQPLQEGGSLALTAGEPVLSPTAIEVQLSAEGATMIYYNYCSLSEATQLSTTEQRVEWLLTQGNSVTASSILAQASGLMEETNYILMALAVDSEGKYGSLYYKAYKTEKLPFNDMTVTIDESAVVLNGNEVTFSWSADGSAKGYLCYFGRTDYTYWNDILGGSVASAQVYMSLNDNDPVLTLTANTSHTFTNLKPGAEYIFLVMAEGSEGLYSVADSYTFTTEGTPQAFIPRYNADGSENPAWKAYEIPAVTFGNSFVRGGIYRVVWKVATVEGLKVYTVVSNPEFVATYYSSPREWAEKMIDGGEDLGIAYNCDIDGNNDKIVAPSLVTNPDQYYIYPYATAAYLVYVAWEDADGNLYEAVTTPLPVIETE